MACGFGDCWMKSLWAIVIGAAVGAGGFVAYKKYGHKLGGRASPAALPAVAGLAGGWGQRLANRRMTRMWR
jgi:hypothetical protein